MNLETLARSLHLSKLTEQTEFTFIPKTYTHFDVYWDKGHYFVHGKVKEQDVFIEFDEASLDSYINNDKFECLCDSSLNLYYIGIDDYRYPAPTAVEKEFEKSMLEDVQIATSQQTHIL